MKLSETTFEQFIDWCKETKSNWYTYMTIPRLRVIYDYCAKHKMQCKGSRCRVSWKNNEFLCEFTQPLSIVHRDDLLWSLFHEVWCKAEWAIRCSKTDQELGYSSVKSTFGMSTIKSLREVI